MHAVAGDARELVQSRERGIDLQTLAEALGQAVFDACSQFGTGVVLHHRCSSRCGPAAPGASHESSRR
jgi:hypothetical protein